MEGITFTAAESKLLLAIMKHNKAAVQPDWQAVAEECGYSTIAAASACWSRVRKNKLSGEISSVGGGVGVEKKSPGKKAVAKPKKVTNADEVAARKGKGRGKGGKDVKIEEQDAGEEVVKDEELVKNEEAAESGVEE